MNKSGRYRFFKVATISNKKLFHPSEACAEILRATKSDVAFVGSYPLVGTSENIWGA